MKKNNNNENNKLDKAVDKIDNRLSEQEKRIHTAINYNMNYFRVIFASLSIIIALTVVIFTIFGVTSWKDIRSIGELKKEVEKAKKEVYKINEMLEEAALRQIIVLYTTGEIGWDHEFDYHPSYYGFPKQKNFESLYFTGEFRSSVAGDTAYFRFYATDKETTLITDEIKTTSTDFIQIECNLDISILENGLCEFGLAAKTQDMQINKAELKNGYVFVYSKLSANIKNEKN